MRRLVYFVLVLVVTAVLAPTIHAAPAATIYVSNTNDSGAGSLRGQIAAAAPGDTIQFDASLSGQTITLTSGEIIIDKNLTIDGSTLASPVTISGNNSSRIFYLSSSAVSMTSLRLINGNGAGSSACDGGAIYLSGSATLTVDRSEFDNNHASCNGGAIYLFVNSGLTLTNNTFTNNSSLYAGGAVRVANTPSVTVRGNTFVGNTSNEGGALWLSATTLVENNTFFNNNGRVTIYTYETLTLTNNTFVGNDGVTVRNSVAYLHMRNNIIGSCVVAGGTISTNINNWIVDGSCSPAYSGDPHLMALADNGGPTQTAALQPDSPAIDLGISAYCPATDQRGVARHDGDGNGVATCDLGAYETGTMQCSISQGNNYTFANQSNVSLYVNTSSDLGCLYVEELPVNHPNATGVTNGQHLQTGKYWR
ncbi:MAG: right-handed parallel beta-helix repeat-containing protein, partial [Anaerolineales bacterium]|nr:right-handed parallel beta-helix repeat-containing protein [Anaerolineales bacterium]